MSENADAPLAEGASTTAHGTLTFTESGTNQDACAGASPTLTLNLG